MSVLKRTELEDSPLADLHAIASELGLEGFRSKRKHELIDSILDATGAAEEEGAGAATGAGEEGAEAATGAAEEGRAEAATGAGEEERAEPATGAGEEAAEAATGAGEAEPAEAEEPVEEEKEEETSEGTSESTSEDTSEGTSEDEAEEAPAEEREDQVAAGVLDVLANGSGFLRADPAAHSRDDVYVSPAQIRRCELRAGDLVEGPVRPPRRNERHPSLIRVSAVNGRDAEPPEERPWFRELTPMYPSSRVDAPGAAPLGLGSRVAVSGAPGAGATTLLRELAHALLRKPELDEVHVILAGVRPEEIAEWAALGEGVKVVGGSFDRSPDAQAQAAELTVELAKRQVERGGHAAVVVDSLGGLPAATRRRVFGAGRATEQGGTLTVIAAVGDAPEAFRWATTRIELEGGGGSAALRGERLT